MNKQQQLLAATLLIFLSRIPFLFDGYGSEEDAWALRLVAERIGVSGQYEVSRLPGHPLQELVFSLIWDKGSVVFNLLTAILSTAGIYFFMRALQNLKLPSPVLAGCTLAAVPVVYINSTNAMDYTWAMAFQLITFFLLTERKWMLAGVFLGLATGCRITSAAFGLPFLYLVYMLEGQNFYRPAIKFSLASISAALLVFVPVFRNYGWSFFTFYEHFPIPGFSKNFYKGVIAVWGLPFLLVVPVSLILQLKREIQISAQQKQLLIFSLLVIVIVTLMFLRVPLKSAFMIPMVPFIVLTLHLLFSLKERKILLVVTLLSGFILGINLDDPLRGSGKSAMAMSLQIGGQPVALDLLQGLVSADRTKRVQRTAYANKVLKYAESIEKPAAVIAGWWLADILVLEKEMKSTGVQWLYYTHPETLLKLKTSGWNIYFLPEQNTFNDIRFKQQFTDSLAIAYPLTP